MRILLLAGGWSSERDVSLRGAAQIERSLVERGHTVTVLDPALQFDGILETAARHDAAFINLHGSPGEDGLVQALLDRAGCPYQGAGPGPSFLALHKAAAKQVFRADGLLTADWIYLPSLPASDWQPALPYPLFVKANTGGSSLHLYRVNDRDELQRAVHELFDSGQEVLIEPALMGEEITCGVLGQEALPPILIRTKSDFFDYASKYSAGGAEELCPAPLPADLTRAVQAAALQAHRCLGIEGYSRADFILDARQRLFLLEVNTIPGMTATSLIPKEAAAIGLSFGELVERLLQMALERAGRA